MNHHRQSFRSINVASSLVLASALGVALIAGRANAQSQLTVDGMVGQVNGQAIYAKTIFREIEEQLRARGKTDSFLEFRRLAEERIHGQLVQIVTDKLVLTEAERDLTPDDERRIKYILQKEREELIRKYGDGSLVRADRELTRVQGKNVKGVLDEKRAEIVVRRYMQQKFMPKIVIRQKDVLNYFKSNPDLYETPSKRKIRLILAKDEEATSKINQALAEDKAFAEVAGDDKLNRYRPDAQGLYGEEGTITGALEFGEEIAPAIEKLQAGEHTEQQSFNGQAAWIFVETLEIGEKKQLRDVQLQIENELREMQFRLLTEQYRREAEQNGNHTPIEEMRKGLVDIAIARYYAPEDES